MPTSPVGPKLPTRSATANTESGGYVTDDEPLTGEDTGEVSISIFEEFLPRHLASARHGVFNNIHKWDLIVPVRNLALDR